MSDSTPKIKHISRVRLNPQSMASLGQLTDKTGRSAQAVFNTLLPLVALSRVPTPLDEVHMNLEDFTELSLVLTTDLHERMFKAIQTRYDLGVWQTVNLIFQSGVDLYDNPPLPESDDLVLA